jgi:hypothetical protein
LIYYSCKEKLPHSRYKHLNHDGLVKLVSLEEFLEELGQAGFIEYEILYTDYYFINKKFTILWDIIRRQREALAKENLAEHAEAHFRKLNAELEAFNGPDESVRNSNRRITRFIHVYCLFESLFSGKTYAESLKTPEPFKDWAIRLKQEKILSKEDCISLS